MRILQLHTRYRQRGGEDQVVDAEARVLKEAGHQVHQLIERNPENNIRATGSLTLSPWNPLAMRRVHGAIEDFRPDVAHVHNTWFAMSPPVIRVLKKAGVPVVMTLHNYRLTCANGLLYRNGAPCELCIDTHPWHSVRYGCYRGSRVQSVPAAATIDLHRRLGTWTEQVDIFVVLSEFQRDMMIRVGLPQEKLVVKANSVDDPGRRPEPPSSSNVVLYVGRLSNEKGVDLLLNAWRDVAIGGLELVFAGDGPLLDVMREDLPANVTMLGAVSNEEVRQLMIGARVGVLPSRWYEGLPLTMLEFFSSGVPVAISGVGALAQIVGDALGPEWVFRSGDRISLLETLRRMADDAWCDSSGDLARKAFEADFADSGAAGRLVEIYERLPGHKDESVARDQRGGHSGL